MLRYRLRFAFQEIDLPPGSFKIGRGQHCQLTIDDPLVSREHARILVSETGALIEDAGSRNGVFVNGRPVRGAVSLTDGDRIRIGPQELAFGVTSGAEANSTRSTGLMCYCGTCGVPYSLDQTRCPACGSREREQEAPLSADAVSDRAWWLDLAAEALTKAVRVAAWPEAERLLLGARPEIDARLASGRGLEPQILGIFAEAAVALSAVRADARWAQWILSVYADLRQLPSTPLSQTLSTLPPAQRSTLVPAARRVMQSVETSGGPRLEDVEAYKGFEALVARLSGV